MISFHCPQCGLAIEAADERAGSAGHCPRCGELVRYPGNKPTRVVPPAAKRRGPPITPRSAGAVFLLAAVICAFAQAVCPAIALAFIGLVLICYTLAASTDARLNAGARKMVCPHCHASGTISVMRVKSGLKPETRATCGNCQQSWIF